MKLAPDIRRRSRKPSLTPMIDVVFLLLVFFMLASRFGVDAILPLPLASGGGTYQGPPRLVDVLPNDLLLNGQPVTTEGLTTQLDDLTKTSDDVIVLRGSDGANLQRIVTVGTALAAAGFTGLVLIE